MNAMACRILICSFSLVTLSACSGFVGHKLGADGALPQDNAVTGIPFQMSRPEYLLDIQPSADDPTKPVYTLTARDVPDATQRYTIMIDPGIFSDGNFDFNFNSIGGLTESNAVLSSRIVAILNAAVGAASNIIGASALKDEASALKTYRNYLKNSQSKQCSSDIKNTIEARMEVLENAGERSGKGEGWKSVQRLFHYIDSNEKACLAEIRRTVVVEGSRGVKALEAAYNAAHKAVQDSIGGIPDKDKEAFVRNLGLIAFYLEQRAIGPLKELQERLKVTQGGSDLEKKLFGAAQSAVIYLDAQIDQPLLVKFADLFGAMPDAVWRARHLLYIDRTLAQKRVELLQLPKSGPKADAGKLRAEIRELEGQRRTVIGEPAAFARLAKLDAFIADVRQTAVGAGKGVRYAADELIKVREERDRLQAQLEKVATGIVAANDVPEAPKKKIQAKSGLPVRLVTREFVNVVNEPGSQVDVKPEYVLVVEPVRDAPVLTAPAAPSLTVAPTK